MIRRTLIAVAIAALASCSSAAAEQRVVRLVSVDPLGANGSLEVLGPNMGFIKPPIVLTPDGKTAAYRAFTTIRYGEDALFKSTRGRTELVGVGPGGTASGILCLGEHIDCHHLISTDGKRVVFETRSSLLNEDADSCPLFVGRGCVDIYDRVGAITRLLSTADPAGGNGPYDARLDSMSRDGSRVFFNLDFPDRTPAGAWERAEAVSPFPSPDTQADSVRIYPQGASSDGRRVFFSTDDSLVPEDTDDCSVYGGSNAPRGCTDVYERTLEGDLNLVSTGPALPNQSFDARFGGASADGSRVFFTTREKLVPEDTDQCFIGTGFPSGCQDVYEYSNGATRLISVGSRGDYSDFAAVSADGRRVFFSTDEPLVPEDTDTAIDWYELADDEPRLVSTGPAGGNGDPGFAEFSGISRDGSHFFFETRQSLVAADTDDGTIDVYERVGDVTNLVSTGPASPNGDYNAFFNGSSEDGKRVFFTTAEPLVAEDHDCIYPYFTGCPDVYQYSRGVTTLITRNTLDCNVDEGGEPPYCPAFVGASTDARRVFFVTQESLVPEDTDASNDLYVATVPSRACRPDKPGHRPTKCGP
jgi:hypothetical protein